MLVLIAVFNDVTVISIAWDRAKYKTEPIDWNMKILIGKTLFLGGFSLYFLLSYSYGFA